MSLENGPAQSQQVPSLDTKLDALRRSLPIVAINKEPVGCNNCIGACCRQGVTLELTTAEAEQLQEAGTRLQPYKRRRFSNDPKPTRNDRAFYTLVTDCGNLQPDNLCGDYPNRPDACRELQEGDPGCIIIRDRRGLPDQIDYTPITNFNL